MFKSTSPDVAIVGGGSAACVLAARLSEDQNRSVVMLEAGPDFPDPAHTPAMVRFGWGGSARSQTNILILTGDILHVPQG